MEGYLRRFAHLMGFFAPWLGFLALLTFLLFAASQDARGQEYRSRMSAPPVDIYQSMIGMADRKEYGKIENALGMMAPITRHIEEKFKEDPARLIRAALDTKNSDEILRNIRVMIVLDIRDMLDEAARKADESVESAKSLVKTARLNYELLSPYIQLAEFATDQKIKKNFTDSFRELGSDSAFSAEKKGVDSGRLKAQWMDISGELTRMFPMKGS